MNKNPIFTCNTLPKKLEQCMEQCTEISDYRRANSGIENNYTNNSTSLNNSQGNQQMSHSQNYILKNYHSNSNTNLITPIKYINQKSNFKNENIQLTQLRPPNNYNLYNETFQSFGKNIN